MEGFFNKVLLQLILKEMEPYPLLEMHSVFANQVVGSPLLSAIQDVILHIFAPIKNSNWFVLLFFSIVLNNCWIPFAVSHWFEHMFLIIVVSFLEGL